MVDIPVVQQRQVLTVFFLVQVQFLDKVVVPVLRNDRDMVIQYRIPCWFRSCCSSAVVFLPFVPQRQISMVQTVQQTQRFLRCRSFLGGRCPCCADFAVHRLFLSVHSALLVSTADTCGTSVYGVFHFLRDFMDYGSSGRFSTCSFSVFAWFNSGYKYLRRPLMLVILAGMDQEDSLLLWQWHVQGGFCRLRCTSHCFPFSGLQAPAVRRPMILHHGGLDRKDSCWFACFRALRAVFPGS